MSNFTVRSSLTSCVKQERQDRQWVILVIRDLVHWKANVILSLSRQHQLIIISWMRLARLSSVLTPQCILRNNLKIYIKTGTVMVKKSARGINVKQSSIHPTIYSNLIHLSKSIIQQNTLYPQSTSHISKSCLHDLVHVLLSLQITGHYSLSGLTALTMEVLDHDQGSCTSLFMKLKEKVPKENVRHPVDPTVFCCSLQNLQDMIRRARLWKNSFFIVLNTDIWMIIPFT